MTDIQFPEVTYDQIEEQVRALAEKYPEYVYKPPIRDNVWQPIACSYLLRADTADDAVVPPELTDCGCIFGGAFKNLGFTPNQLLELDKTEARVDEETGNEYGDSEISTVLDRLEIPVSGDEQRWAAIVQSKQDQGFTWVEAVRNADEWKVAHIT